VEELSNDFRMDEVDKSFSAKSRFYLNEIVRLMIRSVTWKRFPIFKKMLIVSNPLPLWILVAWIHTYVQVWIIAKRSEQADFSEAYNKPRAFNCRFYVRFHEFGDISVTSAKLAVHLTFAFEKSTAISVKHLSLQ